MRRLSSGIGGEIAQWHGVSGLQVRKDTSARGEKRADGSRQNQEQNDEKDDDGHEVGGAVARTAGRVGRWLRRFRIRCGRGDWNAWRHSAVANTLLLECVQSTRHAVEMR